MIRLFRDMRRGLLKGERFKIYFLYAIGEIVLVMLGILLALRVNNLNEARLEKRTSVQFYQNFNRQILEDQSVLQSTLSYNNHYKGQIEYAIGIIETNDRSLVDTLGYIAMNLSKYSDFDRMGNIYQSIVNSGEVKLIKNNEIAEKIQILEETFGYFNRMEEIHYDLITSIVPELVDIIKYSDRTVQDQERLYDFRFQNIFITASGIIDEKDDVYRRAISQIDELSMMIEQEIEILN